MLVMQMCGLQRERGHEPCVYSIGPLGPLGKRMQAEGFAVRANVGRHFLDSVQSFFSIFKASHPDVVHLHNPTPTIYAGMAARMAGVPSIVSTRHSLVARPRRLQVELKYALAAASCDWVVGICDATVNNLKDIHTVPATKIVRVYNGAVPVARADKEHWPAKSGFTLVFVGRLAPVKNHAFLLKAFHSAVSTMPDLRLWIVGDGPTRKAMESLATELDISSRVSFWGQQLDVAPFLSAADAFVMSSSSEGLPVSLLQAFSVGLPAIVTDVGGMAEVVKLAQAGYTVSLTSPGEMSAAILRLATSDGERRQFSMNAKAAFDSRFTLGKMVDAYTDLYLDTTRNRVRAKE